MAAVDKQAELAWERENGPKFAVLAFASAVLTLLGFVIPVLLAGGGGDDEREGLIALNRDADILLAATVVQGLAFAPLCAAFYYMTRAIGARANTTLKTFWPILIVAPVLLLVGSLLNRASLVDIASTFVDSGPRTVDRAKDLIDDRNTTGSIVAAIGTLGLAASFVLVGVHGMRTGLFSRFMGIIGIASGAFLVIPLLPNGGFPILLFWTMALGFLFLDRWPQGRGPAWETGEPIPWPSAAQVRDAAEAARGGGVPPVPPPVPEDTGSEQGAAAAPSARRRKKKKRR